MNSTNAEGRSDLHDSKPVKSAVYTGTGDKGSTSLVGGRRVLKSDIRIEAYGTTDELNSFIGLLLAESLDESDRAFLYFIQNRLFTLGAYLATDPESPYKSRSLLASDSIRRIEEEIDSIDRELPAIRHFLLPGGCRTAALAHVCRTVCRRAERAIYRLCESAPTSSTDDNAQVFINRLSDYFFVLSRKECRRNDVKEIIWENI